jgi:iron-sulfur cluster assembly protein
MPPLPSFKVMSISEQAAARVQAIVAQAHAQGQQDVMGVRVGVKKGGCAGMSYTVDIAAEQQKGDERIEEHGACVLVEAKAVLFLLGTEMDFESSKMSAQFTFKNPNQTSACGCGESVALTPAQMPV